MKQRPQHVLAVTPADQLLARLGVELAEHIGEDVDPRMLRLAQADLTPPHQSPDQIPDTHGPTTVWLDDETGKPVAYSASSYPSETGEDQISSIREWGQQNGYQVSDKKRVSTPSPTRQSSE